MVIPDSRQYLVTFTRDAYSTELSSPPTTSISWDDTIQPLIQQDKKAGETTTERSLDSTHVTYR